MDNATIETIMEYCDDKLNQIIFSNSRKSEKIKKVTVRPVLIGEELLFQATEYRGTKVFHSNYTKEALAGQAKHWLDEYMKQVEIQSERGTAQILISKKGKATIKRKPVLQQTKTQAEPNTDIPATKRKLAHNRTKEYLLAEGEPVPFLVELGVMTKEGRVVRAKYDKFRQINRFLEFIEDVLPELPKEKELTILDFGCGKSYLTFAMYYFLHVLKGYRLKVTGLDLKEDVIEHCNALAKKFGYDDLHFLKGDIASYEECEQVDMVVTLHACDTATDYALEKAYTWGARVILSVPCCQHELNRTLANDMLAPVLRYGLLKERMAALITDGLRAQMLEQLGYQVQVLEFIDMEHTPKNILIRAVKKKALEPPALRRERRKQLDACVAALNAKLTLYRDYFVEEQDRNGEEH